MKFNSWATFSWLNFETMYPGGYTAEVTCLSPRATEKDVYDFFAHCGVVEHVEIIRSGEELKLQINMYAYHAGEHILMNQILGITRHGSLEMKIAQRGTQINQFASTPAEAITVAQEVVKTMVAKGYVLGKDALTKAKALDESYQVSSTAASKVVELSNRIGLTEKIYSGMEAVKSMDGKYHVSETTMTAASYTGRTAVAAANAVVNSSYFAKGALWVSDVLTRAASVAADLGSHGVKK
ncbi:unnamed protein product [Camellia sinensis]